MPLYVAKEQGFFDKRGLDVTLQTIPINPNIPPALQSDSIQVGTVTPSVLMQAADGGLKLKVIAGGSLLTKESKTPAILVRKGVEIKSPQDFIGKRVGVGGFGATLHVLFRKWLADHGVDAKKVNFVEVALPQTLDVLRGGAIDAAVPAEPFATRIRRGHGLRLRERRFQHGCAAHRVRHHPGLAAEEPRAGPRLPRSAGRRHRLPREEP
jgi:NitT/TauT family transport system substrate-binding protein